jgi:hypothetical protein
MYYYSFGNIEGNPIPNSENIGSAGELPLVIVLFNSS